MERVIQVPVSFESETRTYERQFLVEQKIFDRFYPDLTEEMKDEIDYVLGGVTRGILAAGIGCSLTRSLVPRLCLATSSDSPDRVELVREKFSSLREGITPETSEDTQKLISQLARGPYDLDIKMEVEEDEQIDFGKDLIAALTQLLEGHQFGVNAPVINDEGDRVRLVSGDLKIEAVFGEVPLKPDIKHTEISFYQGEEKVFKAHFGFFGDLLKRLDNDTRFGQVTNKLSVYLPLYIDGTSVFVIEEDIESQREFLLEPDSYIFKYEYDGELEKHTEILLRAIRYAIFSHKELTDVYSDLFTEKTWGSLSEMVKYAVEYFSKDENVVSPELERVYLKEILVCLEADPYLFLLIAEKIGLLGLFPFFKDKPNYISRALLTDNSFTFEMEDGSLLFPSKRDLSAILRQRKIFLKSGVSGLRIVCDALKGEDKKGKMGDRITVEEFEDLIKILKLSGTSQQVSVRSEFSAEHQRNLYQKVNSLLVEAMKKSSWRRYKKWDYYKVLPQVLKRLIEFSTMTTKRYFSFEDFENFVEENGGGSSYLMDIFRCLMQMGIIESVLDKGSITERTYFISPPNVVEDRLRKGVLLKLGSGAKNQRIIKWEKP